MEHGSRLVGDQESLISLTKIPTGLGTTPSWSKGPTGKARSDQQVGSLF